METRTDAAHNCHRKNQEIRRSQIQHTIDLLCTERREVYNTFVFDDDSMKMIFNCILKQFDDYCSPQKNVTFLRYKFFS